MTGTPVQNSLSDLAGLVSFLRFSPYDNPRVFENHLVQLLRTGRMEEAIRRLSLFCKSIMIRRSKVAIELPPSTDRIIWVSFSTAEETHYGDLESTTTRSQDEQRDTSLVLNTIQIIHKLRTVCNLGVSYCFTRDSLPGDSSPRRANEPDSRTREDTIVYELAGGLASCARCLQPIDIPDVQEAQPNSYAVAFVSQCFNVYCRNCELAGELEQAGKCTCDDAGLCFRRPIPTALIEQTLVTASPQATDIIFSTKITTLVEEVGKLMMEKQYEDSSMKTKGISLINIMQCCILILENKP